VGQAGLDGSRWTNSTTDQGLPGKDVKTAAIAPDGSVGVGFKDAGIGWFGE